ncbi:hypothetical protein CW745_15265 [Psychromonas sp. psych-6C06]|uniref:spermidine synthase n=1 Tax=Psychromonas sp. psych-6C06 TaxID=2058089 RepID=UPI000C3376B7|nr:hypothetical protein [Psychromonas sp. psych-6C06]PKF60422.1 hypothetical protein CW745_15265 [Psychromonas sp. psych-6C06]
MDNPYMQLPSINENVPRILHQQNLHGHTLVVKESEPYRWFEYAGSSIQAILNKNLPAQIVSPVAQTLLIFLGVNQHSQKVLNLGLGGGAVERALSVQRNIHLTSIEKSQAIIDVAKQYFQLGDNSKIICQPAEHFINSTTEQYDTVLCDIFIGESNPAFLFQDTFYRQLLSISSSKAVLIINLRFESEEQLLNYILMLRSHYAHIALLEFEHFSNIVLLGSVNKLPDKQQLQKQLYTYESSGAHSFGAILNKMRYIP